MAKQVLFIHGGGEGAHREDSKLAHRLLIELGRAYEFRYPAMPNEDEPNYNLWRRDILREVRGMGEGAILVGHSIGASVLIKMLADRGPWSSIAGVFLLACPFWYDHEVWRWNEVALPDDAADRFPSEVPLFLYHGDNDQVVPVAHLDMYAKAFPQATVRRLRGRNHQLNEDMSEVARDIEGLA